MSRARELAVGVAIVLVATTLAVVPATGPVAAATVALVAGDQVWAYEDTGTPLPAAWTAPGHDDSRWKRGQGQFGYGDGDETTVVSYGPDPNKKWPTTYFRTTFTVTDPTAIADLTLHLLRDDGIIAYLNGTEILRDNVPASASGNWWTFATTWDTPSNITTPHPVDPTPLVAGTNTLAISVHQAFRASNDLSLHATLTATTTDPGPEGPERLLAVGDIAECSRQTDELVADLLDVTPGPIAVLGDVAYPDGSAANFADCFQPRFGPHVERMIPVPGNHEYLQPGAGPYFDTFGAAAGTPGQGWHRRELGAWTAVGINTNCGYVGGCGPGSAQYQWLAGQLATAGDCLLAFGHHPFRTSRASSRWTDQQPLVDLLDDAGLDVYLSGHAHNYERFALLDGAGTPDPAGFRSFVVGTGGITPYAFDDVLPTSEVRATNVYGVLDLTLDVDGYGWNFLPAQGTTFTDSGTGDCT